MGMAQNSAQEHDIEVYLEGHTIPALDMLREFARDKADRADPLRAAITRQVASRSTRALTCSRRRSVSTTPAARRS